MAKPIIVIYPAYGSQQDADNNFEGFPKLAETRDVLTSAAADADFPTDQLSLKTWWVTQPDLAASLALGSTEGELLPQLLFATDDPNGNAGDIIVLAKLVREQINRKNIAIMLATVLRLEKKVDETGKQGFYDPTLQVPLPPIGYNPAGAPGGWLLGINASTYKVELSRYGQMLSDFANSIGKALPLILLGLGVLLVTRRK